jgi:hypothetical protein
MQLVYEIGMTDKVRPVLAGIGEACRDARIHQRLE